jgi:Family of unknown function (DUF6338)
LSVVIGVALGVAFRAVSAVFRARIVQPRDPPPDRPIRPRAAWASAKARLVKAARLQTLPSSAWDRLLTRLANRGEPVVCRLRTRDGGEVLGVLGGAGFADWEVDGRGVLLDKEMVHDAEGRLTLLRASRGVYVPGDHIAFVSVLQLPPEALAFVESDD